MQPARVTTTVDSAAESNNVAHKVSKMRDKKGRHQGPLTACHTETTTLMKHKRIKEHKKKKMKKRSEARRKQSLGRLLMKKNSWNIDSGVMVLQTAVLYDMTYACFSVFNALHSCCHALYQHLFIGIPATASITVVDSINITLLTFYCCYQIIHGLTCYLHYQCWVMTTRQCCEEISVDLFIDTSTEVTSRFRCKCVNVNVAAMLTNECNKKIKFLASVE